MKLLPLFAIAAALAVTDVQATNFGVANVPLSELDSDAAAIQAIKHTLSAEESSCAVTLTVRGKIKPTGLNGTAEKLTAEVCGKKQRFEVQRIRLPDKAMVVAKRI